MDDVPFIRGLADAFRKGTEPEVERTGPEDKGDSGDHLIPAIAVEPTQLQYEGENGKRDQGERGREQGPDGARISGHVETGTEPQ